MFYPVLQVVRQLGYSGLLVLEVPAGSPAATADLRGTHRDIFGNLVVGDIIPALDDHPVNSLADLYSVLDERRAGERVRVDLIRGETGKSTSVMLTLGERSVLLDD